MKIYASKRPINVESFIGKDIWIKITINNYPSWVKLISIDNEFCKMYLIQERDLDYVINWLNPKTIETLVKHGRLENHISCFYRKDCYPLLKEAICNHDREFLTTKELFRLD